MASVTGGKFHVTHCAEPLLLGGCCAAVTEFVDGERRRKCPQHRYSVAAVLQNYRRVSGQPATLSLQKYGRVSGQPATLYVQIYGRVSGQLATVDAFFDEWQIIVLSIAFAAE